MSFHMEKVKSKIMRRVYATFAARLITHPVTVQVVLLVVSVVAFAQLVHVKRVVENLLATELGSLPGFVFNALTKGEWLTVLALGVMVFTAFSLQWRLLLPRVRHLFAGSAV